MTIIYKNMGQTTLVGFTLTSINMKKHFGQIENVGDHFFAWASVYLEFWMIFGELILETT